jgi:hypothetical protein
LTKDEAGDKDEIFGSYRKLFRNKFSTIIYFEIYDNTDLARILIDSLP